MRGPRPVPGHAGIRGGRACAGEFAAGGPSARAALDRLGSTRRPVVVGSPEWDQLTRIRDEFSTVDLGEDESIAIALAEARRGNVVPFVTYDQGATLKAHGLGVATVSFLETLAWLIHCGLIDEGEAADLEQRATARDGWKRPPGNGGPVAEQVATLTGALIPRLEAASQRVPTTRRR